MIRLKTSAALTAMLGVRDLQSGNERQIDPGPGELSRAFFERSGRYVVLDVVDGDTDGDGLQRPPVAATTLATRRCRASPRSASFFGHVGDEPNRRIVPTTGGGVEMVARGTKFEPTEPPSSAYELVPASGSAPKRLLHPALPSGPLHWELRR